jgi:hypothetical protein
MLSSSDPVKGSLPASPAVVVDHAVTIAQLTEVVRQLITSVARLEEWQSCAIRAQEEGKDSSGSSNPLSGPLSEAHACMSREVRMWELRVRLAEEEERRLQAELKRCLELRFGK